jgi:hypothetical protein
VGKFLIWGAVAVVALMLLSSLVGAAIAFLVKLAFYLIALLAVVGGAMYLWSKVTGAAKRSIKR